TTEGRPFETDSGNLILDCAFGQIADPEALEDALKLIPGVVESGLFLGIADVAVIPGPEGVKVPARDGHSEGDDSIRESNRRQEEDRMQRPARLLAIAIAALAI